MGYTAEKSEMLRFFRWSIYWVPVYQSTKAISEEFTHSEHRNGDDAVIDREIQKPSRSIN
ncbi:hypothetical protein Mapa_014109 [Marchantia paleacea]|nr:hypothetical protein Mapa_014109 [Marchantia paleacea]